MIYKGNLFRGYGIYKGTKSKKGFIYPMLNRLDLLVRCAIEKMEKPRAFHLILENCSEEDSTKISGTLRYWAASRAERKDSTMRDQVLYLAAKEIRPRLRTRHTHLHVIADGVQYDDIVFLRKALRLYSDKVVLNKRKLEFMPRDIDLSTGVIKIDPITGVPRRKGLRWCHDLTNELNDYFSRASYICKVQTKVSLKSWSSSKLLR